MPRIFTAINIPKDIQEKLTSYYNENLPARWVKPSNLHITVDFLSYVRDDKIIKTIEEIEEKTKDISSFSVTLNKICFAPLDSSIPKMIWAIGDSPKEFLKISNNALHITLARIKKWEFQRYNYNIDIEQDINLKFMASSLDVMESKLKKGHPEYILLKKILFKS